MMHAYDETYVYDAQNNIGDMIHFAVSAENLTAEAFFDVFLKSPISKEIERGNPKYIAGFSGIELLQEVLGQIINPTKIKYTIEKSPEFWAGWVLAFYQWYTGKTFAKINQFLPMSKILSLYKTHHEADIQKFVETANSFEKRKQQCQH